MKLLKFKIFHKLEFNHKFPSRKAVHGLFVVYKVTLDFIVFLQGLLKAVRGFDIFLLGLFLVTFTRNFHKLLSFSLIVIILAESIDGLDRINIRIQHFFDGWDYHKDIKVLDYYIDTPTIRTVQNIIKKSYLQPTKFTFVRIDYQINGLKNS